MLKPTCPDLLRAVIANIDELVLPQLQGPHARSAANNIKLLLTHVIHRLQHEGNALAADNAEKRTVLAALTDQVGANDLRSRLEAIPSAGAYTPIECLAGEAIHLRQLAVDTSLYVHGSVADIGEDKVAELLGPLRAQLRTQLDRDSAAVGHLTPAEIYDHKGI
jgi:hypothetical protein